MYLKRIVGFVVAAGLIGLAARSFAQTDTTFSYQGELRQGGNVANGSFDLDFSLWDDAAAGSQIGSTFVLPGVVVTDGRFSVELDFGASAFDNTGRWLEITVDATTLSPRQPINRAPYSIQTRGIFVDDGGAVGIGTTSPSPGLALTIQGTDAGGVAQWLGLADLNGETQWHINNIDGGFNIAETGAADYRLFIRPGGNIGIGVPAPFAGLHVARFGVGVWGHNTSGQGSSEGVIGQSDASSGAGVRGIGTSASGFDFLATGAGTNYGATSSRRWKSNVRNIDQPLLKIAQLRGVTFDWDTEHGGHRDVGMIAEEVGEVLPEIVQYEENGVDAIGMDYSKMTPLLVEAVNALRVQNESRLAEKDAEIEALQDRLAQLEAIVTQLAQR